MQSHDSHSRPDRRAATWRILQNNPLFVTALGLCPAIAVTYRVDNAIVMGGAVLVVLLVSNMIFAALGGYIPPNLRFFTQLFIASCLTTVVDLLLRAYAPAILARLGVYVPLIAVNCLVLARSDRWLQKNPLGTAARDGLGMGLRYFFSLLVIALIREIVGHGTITFFPMGGFTGVVRVPGIADHPVTMIAYSAGALLAFGYLQGLSVWIVRRMKERRA